jgi:hypothetical protein
MDPSNLNTPLPVVRHLEFMCPLVCSQIEVESIYFEFIIASDFVPFALFLKLYDYGLLAGYVIWLNFYLTCSSL